MFSSPSRTPGRRRAAAASTAGPESVAAGSVRSSRANTPAAMSAADFGLGGKASTAAAAAAAAPYRTSASALRSARASFRPAMSVTDDMSHFTDAGTASYARDHLARGKSKQPDDTFGEGVTLSRDDMHSVSVFSKMPHEATEALQVASAYDPILASLDPVTGYAQLIMRDRCYVWSYVTPSYEAPACFSFEPPQQATSLSSVPSQSLALSSLVPKGKDREPGLLIVSPAGTIRLCENLSSAIATRRQEEATVPLGSGEVISTLHRCSPSLFIASTSHARLMSIRLIASAGQLRLHATLFAQPRGLFGRLFGAAGSFVSSGTDIISLASCPSGDGKRDIYALSPKTLQKWSYTEGGGEKLIYNEDVYTLLVDHDDRIAQESYSSDSLQLLDASLASEDHLVLLYAFGLGEGGPLHYGLAIFESSSSDLRISSLHSIIHSKLADSRPYSQARLVIPFGGPIVLIVLSEAIVIRCFGHHAFEEVIELREAADNRIIGVGYENVGFTSPSGVSRATVVTQSSGIVLVNLETKAIEELAQLIETSKDRNVVDTRRLKSKLERGVFHSDALQNPVSFDLPIEVRGDLQSASEQLSDEIVRSASPAFAGTIDLRLHLASRLEKLHSLAVFLASNGRLGMLSQNCLRRLCADAQLIAAAIDLWEYQNEVMSDPFRRHSGDSLLLMAIEQGSGLQFVEGGDILRTFFRFQLRELPSVLQAMRVVIDQSSAHGISSQTGAIYEGNNILLTAFQASMRFRRETANLYRLDDRQISAEAWTATADIVRLVRQQTALTANLIRERTRQLGTSVNMETRELFGDAQDEKSQQQRMQQALRGQLCELSARTLDVYEERLAFLRAASIKQPGFERDTTLFEAEYLGERGAIIMPLVDIGRSDRAFHLAEEHADFSTLTHLCISLPEAHRNQRIRSYLNKYGELYATALFTYYVDHGLMHSLLSQDENVYGLLKGYLDANPGLGRVAWLHDLVLDDPLSAKTRLLQQADGERSSIASRRLMLSVAKLCHVSELSESQIATQSEQSAIEVLDDQLDLVNVHSRIREALSSSTDDDNLNEAVGLLGEARPGFRDLFIKLANALIEGKALLCEDLIDLLTLHDANESSLADFALAIEVFVRAKGIPQARAECALTSLWRRVILFDDWAAVTQTTNLADEEVAMRLRSTALYQTMLAAASNESTSEAIRAPAQCGVAPSVEALQARLAEAMLPTSIEQEATNEEGAGQEEITTAHGLLGRVLQDCHGEIYELQEVLESAHLDQWYAEVQRLVQLQLSAQGDGVVSGDVSNGAFFDDGRSSQVMVE